MVKSSRVYACVSNSLSYTDWWWRRKRGWERGGGRKKHLPHPSVQQRGYVPVKSHHKPGHGHAGSNRPDPRCPVFSDVAAKKLFLPSRPTHPLYIPRPPAELRPAGVSGRHFKSPNKKLKKSVHKKEYVQQWWIQILYLNKSTTLWKYLSKSQCTRSIKSQMSHCAVKCSLASYDVSGII